MFLGSFISRQVSVGGLCCLMVISGLPRSWCLCPDEACRTACNARSNPLAVPAPSESTPAECCCCEQAARTDEAPADALHLARNQCACQMHVTQLVLLKADRDIQSEAFPLVLWVASATLDPSLGDLHHDTLANLLAGLPPDNPVTRAQILRL